MIAILLMSAKLATPGLLKLKVFWNKGNEVIILVSNDFTNKIWLRYSNSIAGMVMWQKFDNSSISMKEIIMTTI